MARWTRLALADLDAAVAYVAQDDRATTEQVATRIWAAAARLDQFPDIGRPGRRQGTRELVLPRLPFVLVYRAVDGAVTILRLLHTARRWPDNG